MTYTQALDGLTVENEAAGKPCPDLSAALVAMRASILRGDALSEGEEFFLRCFAAGWPEERDNLPALEC